jgi:hypothetical protein
MESKGSAVQPENSEPIQPETLQEFCDRWKVDLSWGYRYTRMRGQSRLPHVKAGKYIRIIPHEADEWMRRMSN